MKFPTPLTKGKLVKRYKRFLADVELETGEIVVAHCGNSGSMLGLKEQDYNVYLSPNTNPKAKLDWRWEMVEVSAPDSANGKDTLVCINTSHPNRICEAAIEAQEIPELTGYATLKREVKYGQNSRIDLLLTDPLDPNLRRWCYVEVKSVTLARPNLKGPTAEFPDSVTARGTKHLQELMDMVAEGHRAVMLYLVGRDDCKAMTIADDIDPTYGEMLVNAMAAGVEIIVYQCTLSTKGIAIDKPLPFNIP